MLATSQTLDMTPIGMIFRILKTPADTAGQSLEMEWTLLPRSGGTPLHTHPTAKESYTVLEGQLELNINGKWQLLQPGETVTVPEGTPHTFRNPGNDPARVYNTHSPALRFDEYFEGLSATVNKLSQGSRQPLKMDLNTATHLCMLMKKYRKEIVSVNPPGFIVSLLNALGKIRGIRI
jgi:mannose-6-phosphate isomerase-like protein (cupin superfamily)